MSTINCCVYNNNYLSLQQKHVDYIVQFLERFLFHHKPRFNKPTKTCGLSTGHFQFYAQVNGEMHPVSHLRRFSLDGMTIPEKPVV